MEGPTYYIQGCCTSLAPEGLCSWWTSNQQIHLRNKAYEDALEFCDRALHVNPQYVKALSRRAVALEAQGDCDKALRDLEVAAAIDGENQDIQKQLRELRQVMDDRRAEEEVERLKIEGAKQQVRRYRGDFRLTAWRSEAGPTRTI